jgi:hypothetical protein
MGMVSARRQSAEQLERRGEMSDRLGMRSALGRLLAGELKVVDGLLSVAAAAVVVCELAIVFVESVGRQRLDRLRDSIV